MGLLSVPKTYKPRKGAPKEDLIYASKAEQGLLRRMTDGKSDMTKHGIPSFYMEGSSSGNYRDSSPSQTSTRSTSSNTGTSGTGGSTNQGRGGSPVGGSTSDRAAGSGASQGGQGNTNTGNRGTGGSMNVGRGGSGVGGGLGFGRDPAMGSNYGRGSWGMQQGGFNSRASQIARSAATAMNRSGPQYSGPARFGPGAFNANRSQQVFGGYPNSMSGMMPGQPQGFATSPTVNPMAPQASQSTFPARPAAIAQNNVYSPPEVSAMKQARLSTFPARPGVIAENNVYSPPEVSAIKKAREFSQLGYQDPRIAAGTLTSPYDQPTSDIPIPRQNPLSDISKFNFVPGRDRDYIFSGNTDIDAPGETDQVAVSRLVDMQAKYGEPLTITSGYRGPNLNADVDGKPRSTHLPNIKGDAFDIHTTSKTRADYDRLVQSAKAAGFLGGYGAYGLGSLHVDTGVPRAWGPMKGPALAAMDKLPSFQPANAPAPPKATVMRNVVTPALMGVKNLFSPSIPRPQPKPQPQYINNRSVDTWSNPASVGPPVNLMPRTDQEEMDAANPDAAPERDLYARQNRVQQIASSIMDHLGPGTFGPGNSGAPDTRRGGSQGRAHDGNSGGGPNTPVTPPLPPLTVNQTPWFFPQYTQSWAGLPQGQGGMFGRA